MPFKDKEKTRERSRNYMRVYREENLEACRQRSREHAAGNREYYVRQSREFDARMRELVTNPRTGFKWSAPEDDVVLRSDISVAEKAVMLQRSYRAVGARMRRLTENQRKVSA